MGCGASLPSDADFKDQTIHGNETRHSYEMKLRMSLITKFERPDKYSNVDVTELVWTQSETFDDHAEADQLGIVSQ
ncbi:Uncharacterized protein SCF082_LOCUS3677 [Durusdinium trenchii]|uniref:Uncharacterized protein n=1 Tax=Durusdinium trenchii TaxID=1381693 RepID=A0ABP0HVV3_9DINO